MVYDYGDLFRSMKIILVVMVFDINDNLLVIFDGLYLIVNVSEVGLWC